jgi:hypothetical protein
MLVSLLKLPYTRHDRKRHQHLDKMSVCGWCRGVDVAWLLRWNVECA